MQLETISVDQSHERDFSILKLLCGIEIVIQNCDLPPV